MATQLSKRQQQRNEQILHGLLKEPGNGKCADCFAPNPSWASYNLGIFLCTRCATIHRKIGTHISKTKSLTLDKWTPEQIATMRATGNTLSNQKYNPNNKPTPTSSSEDTDLERFIRAKYERKSLIPPGPPSGSSSSGMSPRSSTNGGTTGGAKPKNLPPSPSFRGDPDKIVQILGPPARSPSLQSSTSNSLNASSAQRVSGESFERARSPASTNSSFDLQAPPKPPRPNESGSGGSSGNRVKEESDPWGWTGLENTTGGRGEYLPAVREGVVLDTASQSQGQSLNPFDIFEQPSEQQQQGIVEQRSGTQGISFPPPPQTSLTNPFNPPEMSTSHSLLNLQRSETLPTSQMQPVYPRSPGFQPQISNGPQSPMFQPQSPLAQSFSALSIGSQHSHTVGSQSHMTPFQPLQRTSTFPQTNPMMMNQTQQTGSVNPFVSQKLVQSPPIQVQSPPITPTNPFFLPPQQQQLQPQQPFTPTYTSQGQGQGQQVYPNASQGQQYQPPSQIQQIQPSSQPQQVYPTQYQPSSQTNPQQQSQFLPRPPQPQQPYQPQAQPSFQPSTQYQPTYQFQPAQPARLDKQSILNLFNPPASHPSPHIIQQQSGQWNPQVQKGW